MRDLAEPASGCGGELARPLDPVQVVVQCSTSGWSSIISRPTEKPSAPLFNTISTFGSTHPTALGCLAPSPVKADPSRSNRHGLGVGDLPATIGIMQHLATVEI